MSSSSRQVSMRINVISSPDIEIAQNIPITGNFYDETQEYVQQQPRISRRQGNATLNYSH